MGKATIKEDLGDGLYTVELDHGQASYESEISDLNTKIAQANADIAALLISLDAAEVQLSNNQSDLNTAIGFYNLDPSESNKASVELHTQRVNDSAREVSDISTRTKNLQTSRLGMVKRSDVIEGIYAAEPEVIDIWCADFNTGLTGDVGTIDIGRVGGKSPGAVDNPDPVIRPAGDSGTDAEYDPDTDGQLLPWTMLTANSAYYSSALLPGSAKWNPLYRVGEITSINKSADSAEVLLDEEYRYGLNINQTPSVTADVVYMSCNSAIFDIGDRVMVYFTDMDWEKPVVVGFESQPKICSGLYAMSDPRLPADPFYDVNFKISVNLRDNNEEPYASRSFLPTTNFVGEFNLLCKPIVHESKSHILRGLYVEDHLIYGNVTTAVLEINAAIVNAPFIPLVNNVGWVGPWVITSRPYDTSEIKGITAFFANDAGMVGLCITEGLAWTMWYETVDEVRHNYLLGLSLETGMVVRDYKIDDPPLGLVSSKNLTIATMAAYGTDIYLANSGQLYHFDVSGETLIVNHYSPSFDGHICDMAVTRDNIYMLTFESKDIIWIDLGIPEDPVPLGDNVDMVIYQTPRNAISFVEAYSDTTVGSRTFNTSVLSFLAIKQDKDTGNDVRMWTSWRDGIWDYFYGFGYNVPDPYKLVTQFKSFDISAAITGPDYEDDTSLNYSQINLYTENV